MSKPTDPRADLTERQRAAVEAPAGVAIVAGAGTGKTHTLGHRYLAHLDAGASPLGVVAVTFTERAAHELRARVRRYAVAQLPAGDPRLDELEAAPIGTVHALCLRICRDHPEAAGVPPDVRILDPLEGTIWTEERLEEALERVPARLFDALAYERVRDVLRTLLADPFAAERALAHGPDAWRERVREAREGAADRRRATPGLDAARATLASLSGPDGDAGERTRTAVLAAFAAADVDDPDRAASVLHGLKANVGAQRTWGADRDALRAALATALPALRDWARDPRANLRLGPLDDRLAEVLGDVREAFTQARGALAAAKRRAGVVDFADVEIAALRALDRPEVQAHYRDRWSVLLVDEVQDTSPVQEALLARLAVFCRTTLVGDAKQSIYGFRGADARVFRRMTDGLVAQDGRRVVLDRSFRTHAPLVGQVNDVFAAVLGAAHEPLVAASERAPASGPHLRAWELDVQTGTPATVVRLAEAQRIADAIHALLDEGRPVRDPASPSGVRPVRPGDVAVLARTWAPLDLLAEVLPARGVPAVHTGGGDLLATREAQDGMAALRFLADPSDDVALVALLRGPLMAVGDDELDLLARTSGVEGEERAPSWWDRVSTSDATWAGRAREVLGEALEAARREAPSRLLQRLDRCTGWGAVVAALPGGPRRSADREGFLDLVRQLERDGGDVFGVVRRLRRLLRAGVEVERPALDAEDAVTLTTVHRSKGLEWPVVIVAALDARGRGGSVPVRLDPEVGVALRVETDTERSAEPAVWTLLNEAARADEEEETRRLLYVALTRASDAVVVSSGRASGRVHALLAPGLRAAGVDPEVAELDADAVGWPDPPLPRADGTVRIDAPRPPVAPAATRIDRRVGADDVAWEVVMARVEPLRPEAAALLARLREVGAPAPRGTIAPGPIGDLHGDWVMARWEDRADGRTVALVDPSPDRARTGDPRPAPQHELRVAFDPLRPIEVERALRDALGMDARGAGGAAQPGDGGPSDPGRSDVP